MDVVAVAVALDLTLGLALVVTLALGVGIVVVVVLTVVVVVVVTNLKNFERNQMKKIIEEVSTEGLEKLLGERVTLFCLNYIYTGKLVGVNESVVMLEDAAIVYETGELTSKDWTDAQKLPHDWYVQTGAIESFGILK